MLKDGRVVTNGGRVLSITAVRQDLMEAVGEANRGVATIHFQGATFRRDIGLRGLCLLQQPLYVSTAPEPSPDVPPCPSHLGHLCWESVTAAASTSLPPHRALVYKDRPVGAAARDVWSHLPQTSALRGTRAGRTGQSWGIPSVDSSFSAWGVGIETELGKLGWDQHKERKFISFLSLLLWLINKRLPCHGGDCAS